MGWAAWPHALPCVCPPLPLLSMEEATSRCENIIVFSVLLIAGVIASHKIFVCLFFSSQLGFWFALKSVIHLECWGVASRAERETAELYFRGLPMCKPQIAVLLYWSFSWLLSAGLLSVVVFSVSIMVVLCRSPALVFSKCGILVKIVINYSVGYNNKC